MLSEVYPGVSNITIQMKYVHKAAVPIIMDRTVNVFPTSYAYFHMECLVKGCEKGGYDLTPVIKKMLKKGSKADSGAMKCRGKNGSSPADHAEISYEINVKYKRKSASKKKK